MLHIIKNYRMQFIDGKLFQLFWYDLNEHE